MVDSGKRWRRHVRAIMEVLFEEFPVPRIPFVFINEGRHFVTIFPNGAISAASGHFHRDPENLRICFLNHPHLAREWSRGFYAKQGILSRVWKNPSLNVYRAVLEEFGHYLVFLRDGPSDQKDAEYWDQMSSEPSPRAHDSVPEEEEAQEFARTYEPFVKERLRET
jgi:hypothetical protein